MRRRNSKNTPILNLLLVVCCICLALLYVLDKSPSILTTSSTTSSISTPTPAIPAIPVTAAELWGDYHLGEEYGDSLYKDKTVQVTGTVTSISVFMRKLCIELDTGNPPYTVICLMDGINANSLDVGLETTLRGNCDGTSYGVTVWEAYEDAHNMGYVWLSDCRSVP